MNLLHQRGRKHFLLCKGGKILTNQVGNGGYAALSEQLFQFGNIQRILRCVVGTELVSFQNQFAAADIVAQRCRSLIELGGSCLRCEVTCYVTHSVSWHTAAAQREAMEQRWATISGVRLPSSQARQKCISCRRKWNTWAGAFSHRSSVARLRNA